MQAVGNIAGLGLVQSQDIITQVTHQYLRG